MVDLRSCQCFQIGTHHIGYPANCRVTPELVHGAFARAPTLSQCFNGYILSDLVPVLETISDGLGERVNPGRNTVYQMRLYAGLQCLPGESDDSQRRFISGRRTGFVSYRDPDFEWCLSGDPMEPQRRKQTNHSMGNTLCGFHQTVIGGDGAIGQHVKAAPKTLEPARFAKAGKVGAGDVVRFQVSGANNPRPLGKFQNLINFDDFMTDTYRR